MKLKLSDVLENLAAGELSHLSLFENGADIPFETFNKRLLPHYRDWETDRKSTRLNSSHLKLSRMPSSA